MLGLVNAVGSTISRETEAGIYNHAGPEIGVASTKSFTSQLTALCLLALLLGRQQHTSLAEGQRLIRELQAIPAKLRQILADVELPPLQASRGSRTVPTEALTFYSRALLYQDNGDEARAAEYYRRALEVTPDYTEAQEGLRLLESP